MPVPAMVRRKIDLLGLLELCRNRVGIATSLHDPYIIERWWVQGAWAFRTLVVV
jgi:hypothetical protein